MTNQNTTTDERRVFLAPFSNPTAGRWIFADEVENELAALRAKYGDVDFGAMDSEGFGGLVNEYTPIDEIVRLDEAIETHGAAFLAFAKVEGVEYATLEHFEDAYCGEWDSDREFAEEYIESTGMLGDAPELVARYFDYKSFASDLMFDHYEQDGFYFRNC